MKAGKRPGRRAGGSERPDRRPTGGSKVGTVVLVLGCLGAAAGAFWATQRLLAPSEPQVVASNVVHITSDASVMAANAVPDQVTVAPEIEMGTPPPIDTNDPVQLMNRGTEYLNRGFIEPAIDHYLKALAINPEDEESHFNLAFAYAKQREFEKAIAGYQKALELFPEYGEAHNNLGNLLVQQKRFDEAMKHFAEAIRIDPENSSAYNNRGRCLAAQSKVKEALADFQQAVQIYTNYVEARFNVGMSFVELGQIDEGIRQFEELLAVNPEFEPARRALDRARARKSAPTLSPAPDPR